MLSKCAKTSIWPEKGGSVQNPGCSCYWVVVALIHRGSGYLSQQVISVSTPPNSSSSQDTGRNPRWRVTGGAKLQEHGAKSEEDERGVFPLLILHALCFLITHHKRLPACQSAVRRAASHPVARGGVGRSDPFLCGVCWCSGGLWMCEENALQLGAVLTTAETHKCFRSLFFST